MDSVSFVGVIADGKVRPFGDVSQLRAFCARIGDGVEVVIDISEKKDKRSSAQNRALWGPIYDQILTQVMKGDFRADEAEAELDLTDTPKKISHAKRLVHYGLLAARFKYKTDPVTGQQVPARTSSELNTQEMAEYFKWLQVYCADELHIEVELPDELKGAR
ncbi:hypothetical protein [Gemmatimonas sp.]|uniref:hypothetical protein n=1 Tax=Gemmatimonas sp. TaxID=1962908 RepID=UPI0027BAD60B|nr:hypothetical protein [Gemmatimonas sp.]